MYYFGLQLWSFFLLFRNMQEGYRSKKIRYAFYTHDVSRTFVSVINLLQKKC